MEKHFYKLKSCSYLIKTLFGHNSTYVNTMKTNGFDFLWHLINFICTEGKRDDGLPEWIWEVDGYEFKNYIPSCINPTYCEEDPPHVDSAYYEPPERGTLQYKDETKIIYTCSNPGNTFYNIHYYKRKGKETHFLSFFKRMCSLNQKVVDPKNTGRVQL